MKKYCDYCMNPLEKDDKECPFCGKETGLSVPSHHLLPGTILDKRYLIGGAIGEGGFGITYIGRDINLDIVVAIKEYYPNGNANRNNTISLEVKSMISSEKNEIFSKGRQRFLKEAQILAKFSNKNGIVSVRNCFEENNTAYIVMEYLDGITLKEHLKTIGKMSAEHAIRILMPVMQSLKDIHAHGLIHRDISPDNIMIVDDNVTLIDFGAARTVSSKETQSVANVLKPGYAPEEQYRTKGNQGPWTDVYALCATIYKCITGETPIDANERVHEDELKTPTALGIQVDQKIEKALMKGLSVHQKDRYQSIDDLVDGFNGIESYNSVDSKTIFVDKIEEINVTNTGSTTTKEKPISEEPTPPFPLEPPKPKPEEEGNGGKGKKIAVIVVAVLLLIVLIVGITVFVKKSNESKKEKDTTTVTSELSESDDPIENQIVELLLNDSYFMTEYLYISEGSELYYTFLDMDFDGINELIINEHDLANGYNYNSFVKFDVENNCYNYVFVNGGNDFGINGTEIELFSNNKEGVNPYYIVENVYESSSDESQSSYAFLDLVKLFCAPGVDVSSDIYSTNLFEIYLNDYSIEKSNTVKDSYVYYDDSQDKEYIIKKSEFEDFWEEKKEEFLQELSKTDTNLNLKYYVINGQEFNDMSSKDKENALRQAYRAFSYEGKTNASTIPTNVIASTSSVQTTKQITTYQLFAIKTNGGNLNMREEPNETAEIIAQIPNGSYVYAMEFDLDWVCVEYNEKIGWVKSNYLVDPSIVKETESPTQSLAYSKGSIVNGEYVNEWADLRVPIPDGYSEITDEYNASLNSNVAETVLVLTRNDGQHSRFMINVIDCPDESAAEYAIAERNYQVEELGASNTNVESCSIAGYTYYKWDSQFTGTDDEKITAAFFIRKVDDKIIALEVYGEYSFTVKPF